MSRWRDATPAKNKEINAAQKHKDCLVRAKAKARVENQRDNARQHFENYRENRLFQLEYRPYGPCSSVGHLATPCSVAQCESGYNWRSVSHAYTGGGMYGILDSAWRDFGGLKYASHPYYATPNEQSIISTKIYRYSGSAGWQCQGNW